MSGPDPERVGRAREWLLEGNQQSLWPSIEHQLAAFASQEADRAAAEAREPRPPRDLPPDAAWERAAHYWWMAYCELERRVDRAVREKLAPLAKFARHLIRASWEGCDADGGEVQDLAESLGLISRTRYDPEKHGEDADALPGDPWFIFSDLLPSQEESGQ